LFEGGDFGRSGAWVSTEPASDFAASVVVFCCKTFPASEAVFDDDFSLSAILSFLLVQGNRMNAYFILKR
jgi:hypothetical protein